MEICELRQKLLDHDGHALVIGGPGSGKTTIALKKAVLRIEAGLLPGQSVLFLSFSRAAVARVAEAVQTHVAREHRAALNMQTFHSFFWETLAANAYLLGSPKPLKILLPHDEEILFGKIKKKNRKDSNPEWRAWLVERNRLFREEGKMAFDLFFPSAVQLVERSAHIRRMIAQRYPLIIVDEAQDTNSDAWRCIELLSKETTIICLADLEQQIFDYLPGIGPERIEAIKAALDPLKIDLAGQNHRSPDSEIVAFAEDVLKGVVRVGPYKGVSSLLYNPKPDKFDARRVVRMALGTLQRRIRKETGKWGKSIAILTHSGSAAAKISAALNSGDKPVKHKLLFDENIALLSARIAAYLLEPKLPADRLANLASTLEMFTNIERAKGSAKVASMQKWIDKVNAGKVPTAAFVKNIASLIDDLGQNPFSGNPTKDWLVIKSLLRQSLDPQLQQVAVQLDYLVSFNRGKRIAAGLSQLWEQYGCYRGAENAFEVALAQDQLLGGADDPNGLQLMTIHKSKGKQFDGVIIFRSGRFDEKEGQLSSFIWRDDVRPYHRSRKILRVAITRAMTHTLILNPMYPPCEITGAYRLA
ncbi:UvrD-helicase domain-containing protein [Oxalobacteraceae bacterium OTU3REALA1]|nr:UvrD-helicase domain-containing protein [Oxalobacteraceae bacterium OTU3REALA1]